MVISHCGSGCLGLSQEPEMWPPQESSLMLGVPAGCVASSPGCVRASWAGTVTVSGGGFLTSGLEGSVRNQGLGVALNIPDLGT